MKRWKMIETQQRAVARAVRGRKKMNYTIERRKRENPPIEDCYATCKSRASKIIMRDGIGEPQRLAREYCWKCEPWIKELRGDRALTAPCCGPNTKLAVMETKACKNAQKTYIQTVVDAHFERMRSLNRTEEVRHEDIRDTYQEATTKAKHALLQHCWQCVKDRKRSPDTGDSVDDLLQKKFGIELQRKIQAQIHARDKKLRKIRRIAVIAARAARLKLKEDEKRKWHA
jgi:hypothetical protein